MKQSTFKRGFKAVKEEEEKREQLKKERQGKLWRVYFPKDADDGYEIPFLFLTDEPICFYEHTLNIQGKVVHRTCRGEGCKDCNNGNKPRFVGAFLGIDRSEFEIDERDKSGNKTGKKKTIDATAKLLVRGQTDLAQLDRLNNKYGLCGREWFISKTGKDTSTKWMFDRGEEEELTKKEIKALLPEVLRDKDFYEIVEEQIQPVDVEDEEEDDNESEQDFKGRATSGVRNIDEDEEDEEEEETPRRGRAPRAQRGKDQHSGKGKSSGSKRVVKRK